MAPRLVSARTGEAEKTVQAAATLACDLPWRSRLAQPLVWLRGSLQKRASCANELSCERLVASTWQRVMWFSTCRMTKNIHCDKKHIAAFPLVACKVAMCVYLSQELSCWFLPLHCKSGCFGHAGTCVGCLVPMLSGLRNMCVITHGHTAPADTCPHPWMIQLSGHPMTRTHVVLMRERYGVE